MKRVLKRGGIAIVVIFLGIQAVQPERTNPPVDESKTIYAHIKVPPEIKTILERSCIDCHTHNTRWPWYSYVAPTSWLVTRDVRVARSNLNLSMWGDYNEMKQIAKLDQICQELLDDKMPIKPYRTMHPNAELSKAEIDMVCDWVEEARNQLMNPDTTQAARNK